MGGSKSLKNPRRTYRSQPFCNKPTILQTLLAKSATNFYTDFGNPPSRSFLLVAAEIMLELRRSFLRVAAAVLVVCATMTDLAAAADEHHDHLTHPSGNRPLGEDPMDLADLLKCPISDLHLQPFLDADSKTWLGETHGAHPHYPANCGDCDVFPHLPSSIIRDFLLPCLGSCAELRKVVQVCRSRSSHTDLVARAAFERRFVKLTKRICNLEEKLRPEASRPRFLLHGAKAGPAGIEANIVNIPTPSRGRRGRTPNDGEQESTNTSSSSSFHPPARVPPARSDSVLRAAINALQAQANTILHEQFGHHRRRGPHDRTTHNAEWERQQRRLLRIEADLEKLKDLSDTNARRKKLLEVEGARRQALLRVRRRVGDARAEQHEQPLLSGVERQAILTRDRQVQAMRDVEGKTRHEGLEELEAELLRVELRRLRLEERCERELSLPLALTTIPRGDNRRNAGPSRGGA